MDPIVQVGVFLVLPYAALAVFVAGVIYRLVQWLGPRRITGLRSVALVPNTFGYGAVFVDLIKRVLGFYTLPKMEKDRSLIWGAVMFHYGIWIVLLSHLALVIPLPLSSQMHDLLGLYVGGSAGVLAFVGLSVLLVRRAGSKKVRAISGAGDYFLVGLLLTVIALGLTQTLYLRPDYMDTVSPWLTSLIVLSPNLSPIAGVSIITTLHVALTLIFIAYVPWSKMAHIVSYVFNPTVTGPSYRVGMANVPPVGAAPAPKGGT